MEAAPLRVIISRPPAQAAVWAQQLQELGIEVVQINLLDIIPLENPTQVRAIQTKILNIDLYQKIIFVSQNAVHHGMRWVENYWPQVPIGIKFFAVGATTAKKLADYGVDVEDLTVSNQGSMTSEDLIKAPGLCQIQGEKILIFRGEGGRGHLGDELTARGAQVDYCELYKRVLPDLATEQLRNLLAHNSGWQHWHNIISLHSGESLTNLLTVIHQLSDSKNILQLRELFHTTLLLPSARIAEAARAAGFVKCLVAENATDTAMTSALLNYHRVYIAL